MSDSTPQSVATPRVAFWRPSLYVPVVLLYGVCVAAPAQYRLFVVPFVALLFGYEYARRPLTGTALLLVGIGLPVYIRFAGSDAGTLITALVFVAWAVDLGLRRLARPGRLLVPLALFLVPVFLGLLDAGGLSSGGSAVRLTLGLLSGVLLAQVIATHVRDRHSLTVVLYALAATATLQAAVAVLQAFRLPGLDTLLQPFAARNAAVDAFINADGSLRARGLIGQYELLSEWLAAATIVLVGMASVRLSTSRAALVMAVMCGAGIVATATRGGLIAVLGGLVCFALLAILVQRGAGMRAAAIVVVVVAAGAVLTAALLPGQVETLLYRFGLTSATIGRSGGVQDVLNRDLWLSLDSSATQWTIAGHGFYRPSANTVSDFHSLWYSLRYLGGMMGVTGFALLLGAIAIRLLKGVVRGGPTLGLLSAALLAGLVAIMASEVVVEFLRSETTMQFMGAYLGICLAAAALALAPGRSRTMTLADDPAPGREL